MGLGNSPKKGKMAIERKAVCKPGEKNNKYLIVVSTQLLAEDGPRKVRNVLNNYYGLATRFCHHGLVFCQ